MGEVTIVFDLRGKLNDDLKRSGMNSEKRNNFHSISSLKVEVMLMLIHSSLQSSCTS